MKPSTLFDELPLQQAVAIRTTNRSEAVAFVQNFFPGMSTSFIREDGVFEFQMNTGRFGQTDITAQEHYIAGGASFLVENDEDHLTIEIPITGRSCATVGDQSFDAITDKTIIISSPGQRVLWEDSGLRYRALIFHFDSSLIDRRLLSMTGHEPAKPLQFDMCVDVTTPTGGHFLQAALFPFLTVGSGEGVLDHPVAGALYEEFLISALLTAVNHSARSEIQEQAVTSGGILTKCEVYLRKHSDRNLTISELADELGVSVRSLQRTYQKAHGTSPMRRLKEIRLERAKTRLLNSGPGRNVTQIALSSGFSHLGAFSSDYKKRFGESPSETLQRES